MSKQKKTENNEKNSTQKKSTKKPKLTKIEELELRGQEYLQGWKRAQADYQNLKKEALAEKASLSHYVKAEVLRDLFPVLNNYKLATEHIPEKMRNEAWVQGFIHLQAQFDKFFTDLGVEKMSTEGKEFDVATMEAVEQRESDEHDSNIVIKELRPGYKLGDEVIYPAQVVVAK